MELRQPLDSNIWSVKTNFKDSFQMVKKTFHVDVKVLHHLIVTGY